MSIEENKTLVRRYFQDAPQNPAVCDEIFAPHFLFHTLQHASVTAQVQESSPAQERAAYEWLQAIWGEWQIEIHEVIAEGDRVMVVWTHHGIQQGEMYGLAPTGKRVTYSGINIFRVADGKIAEVWDLYDRLWLWQQLGVLPDLKQAIAKCSCGSSTAV